MSLNRQSFQLAINDFHKARQKGQLQRLFGRLTGQSADLLSYEEVAGKLRATNRIDRGVRVIPVKAIVGSVGRYTDFTRTFLPRQKSDAQRWAGVKVAAYDMSSLPAIEVYQLGESFFVSDGNHRVSIARLQGLSFIDAHVTEVHTRVSFQPDDNPDELILKAEHADFLEFTRLDLLRPETELVVSAPGKYARLEDLIEVHRYFIEVGEDVELSDEDAVGRWHDEAYLPVAEAIREQGVLRYFPNRTETDFYVWLASHQAEIRNELGWQMRPESAVAKLASQFAPETAGWATRVRREIKELVVPDRWKGGQAPTTWSQQKSLDRYSDHLFADILVPVGDQESEWYALDQALLVAAREQAHILGLHIANVTDELSDTQNKTLQEAFASRCQSADIDGNLAYQSGEELEVIAQRSSLVDLLICSHIPFKEANDSAGLNPSIKTLVEQSCAPLLLMPGASRKLDRVLLAYNDQPKSREALFVAAYMAERWGVDLMVISVEDVSRSQPHTLDHVGEYLAMHEVSAELVYTHGSVAEDILRKATEHKSDLIIMGANDRRRIGRHSLGSNAERVLIEWGRPVFVCT